MSIFYNLSKSAERDTEEELRFDSDEGNELLIDKQSEYQVGVVRFKIPMSKVPLFRVYRNDLHLNILGGNWGANDINVSYYRKDNFFGDDGYYTGFGRGTATPKILPPTPVNIHSNSGLYGVDNLKDNGKSFVDLYSHTQFTELLNNSLSKAIVNNECNRNKQLSNANKYLCGNADSVGARANAIVLNQHINVLGFEAGVGITGGNITVPASAIAGVPNGFIMTDFSLDIESFNQTPLASVITDIQMVKTNGQNGYKQGNFKHLRFYLVKGLAVSGVVMPTTVEYYPIINNILDGYDGINPNVSLARNSYRLSIALRSGHNIDAQSQVNTDLFNTNISRQVGSDVYPFRLYPSSTDFSGLLGQRIDNCSVKPYSTTAQVWSIMIVNDTYAPNYADPAGAGVLKPVPYEFALGDIRVCMKGTHLSNLYGEELYREPIANPTYDLTFPQFKYDKDKNQLYLSRTSFWDNHYNLRILMNNKLKALCSFGEYLVDKIDNSFYNRNFRIADAVNEPLLLEFKPDFNGAVYSFPSRIEGQGTDEDLGGKSGASQYNSLTPVRHYESFNTNYSRNWVDSILFISGSIATQGEVVGNGGAVRKVITDFVLDPSSNVRDYLTYEGSGNIRYYPMRTIGPLFKVDVFVRFKDIYGNIRPLNVEPNSVASLKIEFRPNNMVQYYPQ